MPRRTGGRIGPDGSSIPFKDGRPMIVRPTGPLGRQPGLGNPHEEAFFYPGYRGAPTSDGEERPRDIVVDPSCDPARVMSPEQRAAQEALKCTLNDVFARQVIFTKDPANIKPPWFAQQVIKAKVITIAAGETAAIFDRMINARMRAVVTCLGLDIDPIDAIMDRTCEFWFDKGNEDQIIPIFDDQTEVAYEESDGLTIGKTTVLPGSLTIPFNFLEAGLQFHLSGPTMLRFMMENKGDQDVTIRGIMGYYQYWLPYGATEFENADVQM